MRPGTSSCAAEMPPDNCFPFQLEMIDVLRAAMQHDPGDAMAPLYLGNLLFDLQPEAAIEEWEKAAALGSKVATVYRNLGVGYEQTKRDRTKAIEYYEKAVELDPTDTRVIHELDSAYRNAQVPVERRLGMLRKHHETLAADVYTMPLASEIELLALTGEYEKALSMMRSHRFRIWEGGEGLHTTFVNANVLRGLELLKAGEPARARAFFEAAAEFPLNLEAKKYYASGRSCEVFYHQGVFHEAAGEPAEARRAFEKAVAERQYYHSYGVPHYYRGQALKKLGRAGGSEAPLRGLDRAGTARAGGDRDQHRHQLLREVRRSHHRRDPQVAGPLPGRAGIPRTGGQSPRQGGVRAGRPPRHLQPLGQGHVVSTRVSGPGAAPRREWENEHALRTRTDGGLDGPPRLPRRAGRLSPWTTTSTAAPATTLVTVGRPAPPGAASPRSAPRPSRPATRSCCSAGRGARAPSGRRAPASRDGRSASPPTARDPSRSSTPPEARRRSSSSTSSTGTSRRSRRRGEARTGSTSPGSRGTLRHFRVTNVVIHDVGGEVKAKTSGLLVVAAGGGGQTFEDVVIDGVTAYGTTQWAGIVVSGATWEDKGLRARHVTIRNSIVHDVYGDGIVLFQVEDGLIERSAAWRTGLQPTQTIGTPNGIWTWRCRRCTVRWTEGFFVDSPGVDGGIYDIDWGNDDNVVEDNFGHDAMGYCASVFAAGGETTTNSVVRRNVCVGNGRSPKLARRQGDLFLSTWENGTLDGVLVHDNTFYWNPPIDAPVVQMDHADFAGSRPNLFHGNLVYSTVPRLIHSNDGLRLDRNLYWYAGRGERGVELRRARAPGLLRLPSRRRSGRGGPLRRSDAHGHDAPAGGLPRDRREDRRGRSRARPGGRAPDRLRRGSRGLGSRLRSRRGRRLSRPGRLPAERRRAVRAERPRRRGEGRWRGLEPARARLEPGDDPRPAGRGGPAPDPPHDDPRRPGWRRRPTVGGLRPAGRPGSDAPRAPRTAGGGPGGRVARGTPRAGPVARPGRVR